MRLEKDKKLKLRQLVNKTWLCLWISNSLRFLKRAENLWRLISISLQQKHVWQKAFVVFLIFGHRTSGQSANDDRPGFFSAI